METSDSYELLKSRTSSISEGLSPGEHVEAAGCSTRLLESEGHPPPRPSCVCSGTPLPLLFRPAEVTFVHWNWPAIRLFCLLAAGSTAFAVVCVVLGLLFGIRADCIPPDEWWRGALIYEVFPASFQDTDGDGFGDLRGLLQRLDHVQHLGARAVRLNSVYGALDYPLEYEHVIDFRNVDPHLGRLEQLERLVRECHSRDMRLLLDLNPTVTSDQHTWAAHWLLGKYPEYDGFYINGSEIAPEDEFYPEVTSSDEMQVDLELPQRLFGNQLLLNWSNPEVQREMTSVLKFWLRKGVDGFYLKHLERMRVRDDHELFHVLRHWRHLLDVFGQEEGRGRVVLMSSLTFLQVLKNRHSPLLSTIAGYFDLVDVTLDLTLNTTDRVLSSHLDSVDRWVRSEGFPTLNWNVGSAETFRLASRMGSTYGTAALYLLMMMPGSSTLFYGDEMGLQDSVDPATHKVFRSGQLCPMQWQDANFTDGAPWLAACHWSSGEDAVSRLSELVSWKNRTLALQATDGPVPRRLNYRLLQHGDGVVAMERIQPRLNRFLICANFASEVRDLDLSGHMHTAVLRLATSGRRQPEIFNRITLDPGEAVIAEVME